MASWVDASGAYAGLHCLPMPSPPARTLSARCTESPTAWWTLVFDGTGSPSSQRRRASSASPPARRNSRPSALRHLTARRATTHTATPPRVLLFLCSQLLCRDLVRGRRRPLPPWRPAVSRAHACTACMHAGTAPHRSLLCSAQQDRRVCHVNHVQRPRCMHPPHAMHTYIASSFICKL